MLAILALAFLVRLINLNQSLWLDESVTWSAAAHYSFWGIVTNFSPGDVHPPLYYLLIKFWTSFFGFSEISLRFPSVIAGVLTVFVVYLIGKKLFSKKVGRLAALFLAVNPLAVYYSQEARMYCLAALAVSVAVYTFVQKKWFWFFLALVAALYLDYVPWFVIPVFLPAGLFALVFVLPLALLLWPQLLASVALAKMVPLWGQVVGGLSLKSVLLLPVKFIFGRIPTQWWLTIPIIIYVWFITKTKNIFLWAWLVVPIILGFLTSFRIPIFTYHRFLFVLPAFILLLAGGVEKKKWGTVLIIFVSLLSLAVFNLNSNLWREDWRAAAAYVKEEPGEVIMPNMAQSAPLTYYGVNLNAGGKVVYLFRYVQEIFDPSDSQRKRLEMAGYKNIQQKDFNGVVVWKYEL